MADPTQGRDPWREAQAAVIRRKGYCQGCGSKVKRKKLLAYRHAVACSMASYNREENAS